MGIPDFTPEETELFAEQVDKFIEAIISQDDTVPKEIAQIAHDFDAVLQGVRNDHAMFAMVLVMRHLTDEMDRDNCAIALAGFAKMVAMLRAEDDEEVEVVIVEPPS